MNTTQISLVWYCNGFYLRVYCVVWKWFGQQQRTMVLLYSNHPLVGDRPKEEKSCHNQSSVYFIYRAKGELAWKAPTRPYFRRM